MASEHNSTPIQMWLAGMLQQKHSDRVAVNEVLGKPPLNFGIDYDGPIHNDIHLQPQVKVLALHESQPITTK